MNQAEELTAQQAKGVSEEKATYVRIGGDILYCVGGQILFLRYGIPDVEPEVAYYTWKGPLQDESPVGFSGLQAHLYPGDSWSRSWATHLVQGLDQVPEELKGRRER